MKDVLTALIAAIATASAAGAWEFTPGTPCILAYETDNAEVELTYDPTEPLYTISLTQSTAFPIESIFEMQFLGSRSISIATNQHKLSNAGRTLTVTDHGFGNVLDGLQFNDTAIATLGNQVIELPLKDAAGPVARFRECDEQPAS